MKPRHPTPSQAHGVPPHTTPHLRPPHLGPLWCFALTTSIIVLLTGCTPSASERAARDVARAFTASEFRTTDYYDSRSTLQYIAADPRVRADAKWFSQNLGYSVGYTLGRMLLP